MTCRFLPLLLIFTLVLQAAIVVPVSAAAGKTDSSQMDHRDCAGTQASEHASNPDCPCCPDGASSAAGCANYCITALAVFPAGLSFAVESGATYASLMTQPLVTRFDIPPTPPPIA